MKTQIIFFFIIIFSFSSCKKSHPLQAEDYPMHAGDSWTYRFTFATYNFRPIQSGKTFPTDTIILTSTVFNRGKVWLNDSVQTWKFQCDGYFGTSLDTFFIRSYHYYQKKQDTLCIVAYSGGSNLSLPKSNSSAYNYTFHNKLYLSLPVLFAEIRGEHFNSTPADTEIIYEERPTKSFVFPLKKGKEWDYRIGFPFKIHKKVLGTEMIQIPFGNMETNKIQWFWDFDDDGVYEDSLINGYDYVIDDGLVKREFYIKDVTVTSPEGSYGLIDVRETYELISINTKNFFY